MMYLNNNRKTIGCFIFLLGLAASTASMAWHGHHHGGHREIHRHLDYGPSYHRGFSYGGGWVAPNVIIEVPAPGYYVPRCQTVEVCNPYGSCWLENNCN